MDRRRFLKVAGSLGAAATLGAVGGATGTILLGRKTPPSGTLAFYNWDAYIFEPLFEQFKRETGVTAVQMDLFYSEDEIWQYISGGGGGYDLSVLTDGNVSRAAREGLVEPIDRDSISNLDLLLPNFRNPSYDPELDYSVPYLWGTSGIIYNAKKLTSPYTLLEGWTQLFDPNFLAAYNRKIAMINDMRETVGAALVYLGYSANETSSTALDRAKTVLLDQRPYLAGYTSTTEYLEQLRSGNWVASHAWNGDGVTLQSENDATNEFHYIVPKEGGIIWVDNFVIPRGAKNRQAAMAFIDFLLDPAHETLNTLNIGFPNPNAMSFQWLPASFKQDQAVYPPEDVLAKLQFLRELTPEAEEAYTAIWDEVTAGT